MQVKCESGTKCTCPLCPCHSVCERESETRRKTARQTNADKQKELSEKVKKRPERKRRGKVTCRNYINN